jgi:glucosylceramidase
MATFLGDHLGPTLAAAGYGDIILMGFDHNKGGDLVNYASAAYDDANADRYTGGMAHHWYGSTTNYQGGSLAEVHNMRPDKLLVASEQSVDNFQRFADAAWQNEDWWWEVNALDWANGASGHEAYAAVYRYAEDIIVSFNNWNNAWISWNAVLDRDGGPNWFGVTCSADVMIDLGSDTPYYTPAFYVVQQFSRFMLPGGHVLAVTVLNKADSPVDYQIDFEGQAVAATIPGPAVQTIVLR